jgi:DNA-binding LacI/PurR family transcriptional regulator
MRTSLKEIAQMAGVSVAAVSYALRGVPKISTETRERVMKVAKQLGYVRDPQMSHAFAFIRRKEKPVYRETLALIADYRQPLSAEHETWMIELRAAAAARAAELGYGFAIFNHESTPQLQRHQSRQLSARGIRGIIVTPDMHQVPTEINYEWGKFVAVEFDQSMSPAILTRVTRDVADDYIGMFENLHARGYRRIGLAITRNTESRHHQAILSAYLTWNYRNGSLAEIIPELESGAPDQFMPWISQVRPDALILNGDRMCEQLRDFGLDIGICRIDATDGEWSGLRPDYSGMGHAAVEFLASSLERGEIGLPARPRILNIPSFWHEGTTLRPCPVEAGRGE